MLEKAGILALLLFKGNHPSVQTFLEQFKLDAANQKFNIMKAMGGNSNPQSKEVQGIE